MVDTPNRLCPFDHHTALLPFYSALPAEVRLAYADRSPREDFKRLLRAGAPGDDERLTRWGCGISYHEFEIGLSGGIHGCIVADGWEPEIVGLLGILPEDALLELQLKLLPLTYIGRLPVGRST